MVLKFFSLTTVGSRVLNPNRNGVVLSAKQIGQKKVTVYHKDGSTEDVTLTNLKYVPDLWVNLFSIGQALKNGFAIGNKGVSIKLVKGSTPFLKFDCIVPTSQGFVIRIEMKSLTIPTGATMIFEQGCKMDINKAHGLLGHASMASVNKMSKGLGWTLMGDEQICRNCARGKSKQAKLPRMSGSRSSMAGEQLCINICNVKTSSFGDLKYWLLAVDEAMDFCWSYFIPFTRAI